MGTFDPLEARLWGNAAKGDLESIAALIALLTTAADEGSEAAAVDLNRLMDALTAEQLVAAAEHLAKPKRQLRNGMGGLVSLGGGFVLVPMVEA